ncbi:hypothetical protein [Paenirhodobacter sp.]|uniref:hypothetical protein n=1 Tax=Paenirhodobacter sp. TaxID=1965326 RepID=UPI003B40D94E
MRALWLIPVALSACGPVPVEQAERQCLARVQPVRPLEGEAGLGVTSSGPRTTAKVRINMGTYQGDPAAAYDRCVYDRSGRMPTRPLYARTDWRG